MLKDSAVAPSLQTAIYEFLMYACTAFLSSYISAGGFAFFAIWKRGRRSRTDF